VLVKRFLLVALPLIAVVAATTSHYDSARAKIDSITSDKLKPGSRVNLSAQELQAYAEREVPDGVRDPRLSVIASQTAKGSAIVDFLKLRQSLGYKTGWLMSQLLQGERPVTVIAKITSARGQATVDVQSVTIGGMQIDGNTLDFLIQNVLLRMYPDAVVERPFELGHRIERLEVEPKVVSILIGK
jgi:hypothetical protein